VPKKKAHILDPNPARKPSTDLTGTTINQWTVIGYAGREGWVPFWNCRCACGTETIVSGSNLSTGKTISCGCHRNAIARNRITHGLSRRNATIPEYGLWANIIQRTTNPNNPKWMDYGGRGIGVSDAWRDFATFYSDMGPRPSKHHSVGRIDNNSGYRKDNCRWEVSEQQVRNKRNNVLVTYKGETLCRHEMAAKYGIKYFTLRSRLLAGMTPEEAIETPIFHGKRLMKRKRTQM
jgi:hypothetical protein